MGGLGCAPVPAATGGPNPPDRPDDDDDGDEDDEEEPSDDDDDNDDDDDHRRNRRSRDRRDHDNGRPRISQKEAERVNVPPWPKITKLDSWKMALTMNVTSASADPDTDEEGKIQPKKKDGTSSSKDAAPAESTKVNAPSAKRIKATLKERWVVISGCTTGAYGRTQIRSRTLLRESSWRTWIGRGSLSTRSMGQSCAWTPNVFKILVQPM